MSNLHITIIALLIFSISYSGHAFWPFSSSKDTKAKTVTTTAAPIVQPQSPVIITPESLIVNAYAVYDEFVKNWDGEKNINEMPWPNKEVIHVEGMPGQRGIFKYLDPIYNKNTPKGFLVFFVRDGIWVVHTTPEHLKSIGTVWPGKVSLQCVPITTTTNKGQVAKHCILVNLIYCPCSGKWTHTYIWPQ